jgi:hypothetical protein
VFQLCACGALAFRFFIALPAIFAIRPADNCTLLHAGLCRPTEPPTQIAALRKIGSRQPAAIQQLVAAWNVASKVPEGAVSGVFQKDNPCEGASQNNG